jgi:hypothetical protein
LKTRFLMLREIFCIISKARTPWSGFLCDVNSNCYAKEPEYAIAFLLVLHQGFIKLEMKECG